MLHHGCTGKSVGPLYKIGIYFRDTYCVQPAHLPCHAFRDMYPFTSLSRIPRHVPCTSLSRNPRHLPSALLLSSQSSTFIIQHHQLHHLIILMSSSIIIFYFTHLFLRFTFPNFLTISNSELIPVLSHHHQHSVHVFGQITLISTSPGSPSTTPHNPTSRRPRVQRASLEENGTGHRV